MFFFNCFGIEYIYVKYIFNRLGMECVNDWKDDYFVVWGKEGEVRMIRDFIREEWG